MSKSKFHGLSSPEDLIEMWKELKHDDDSKDINVIWDYEHPEQLKPGFNIVNILYDSNDPDQIGHYVLITVNDKSKEVEYFDPISSHTPENEDEIDLINEYFKNKGYSTNISLEGTQKESSENCGYHCLTHAFNLYLHSLDTSRNPIPPENKSGRLPENPSSKDILMDILKMNRAIYYVLKNGSNAEIPPLKIGKSKSKSKESGAGLADDVNNDKYYSFSEIKDLIE
jgi:hypothetical protein